MRNWMVVTGRKKTGDATIGNNDFLAAKGL
jgi:hypothetical protein